MLTELELHQKRMYKKSLHKGAKCGFDRTGGNHHHPLATLVSTPGFFSRAWSLLSSFMLYQKCAKLTQGARNVFARRKV